jgi:hypothetical protein
MRGELAERMMYDGPRLLVDLADVPLQRLEDDVAPVAVTHEMNEAVRTRFAEAA